MKNKVKEYYKSNPDIGMEHDKIARDVCKNNAGKTNSIFRKSLIFILKCE